MGNANRIAARARPPAGGGGGEGGGGEGRVGASVGGGTPQQCSLFCLQFDPSLFGGVGVSHPANVLISGPAASLKGQESGHGSHPPIVKIKSPT